MYIRVNMNRKDIYKILKYPCKQTVINCLNLVNLKDKELKAIELVDIKGFSELKASELMGCSVNTVKNYRKRAFEKMLIAWEYEAMIMEILESK